MIARLGIVGAGHLAGFVAEGLRRSGWDGAILIPDRPSAASFAARTGAQIARAPQTVIEGAEAVLVALRPADAEAVLSGLRWREGMPLLSAMAGVKRARLEAFAPGARVVRAMPISAAAIGASPTPVFPRDAAAEALFGRLGAVVPMPDEAALEAASANAAAYGWFLRLIDRLAAANRAAGQPPDVSKRMAAETLIAAARVAREDGREGEEILAALATPGGITEQGLRHLDRAQAFEPWSEAFAAVAARLKED